MKRSTNARFLLRTSRKLLGMILGCSASLGIIGLIHHANAQRFGGAHTAQGDILRGQGAYLVGAGWYNLNTARAANINVDTWKKYNMEVQRLYHSYLQDRYLHIRYKKKLTQNAQDEVKKKFEEERRRWRENPTVDDIASGDALNALASDLADPSIHPSAWDQAKVPLPPGLTLTALSFRIAEKKTSTLFQNVVAIDRMRVAGDEWPIWLRRPELKKEQAAFEKAVATVMTKCQKGTTLEARDVDSLRDAVQTLQKQIPEVVPSRDGQRSKAIEYGRKLDDATRIFADQAYAERLIRDVTEHKAETVAQLLGFMRYHRLLFADPGASPEHAEIYSVMYELLRQQKEKLGVNPAAAQGPAFGSVPPVNPSPRALQHLQEARNILARTNFSKTPKRHDLKQKVDSALEEAIRELNNGNRPREPLQRAGHTLRELVVLVGQGPNANLLRQSGAESRAAWEELHGKAPGNPRAGGPPAVQKKGRRPGPPARKGR